MRNKLNITDQLLTLVQIARNIDGDLIIRYSEPSDCFECEMTDLGVTPEKRVYIKRCYDLDEFVEKCKQKWPNNKNNCTHDFYEYKYSLICSNCGAVSTRERECKK